MKLNNTYYKKENIFKRDYLRKIKAVCRSAAHQDNEAAGPALKGYSSVLSADNCIVPENSRNAINETKPGSRRSHRGRNNGYSSGQFKKSLFVCILLFCGVTSWLIKANAMHKSNLQAGIAEEIIRFHVIANSDSGQDQALKLKVKDQLVESLSPLLSNTDSITDARAVLSDHLTLIQEIAENTLKQNGCSYPVSVALEKSYFPLKIYGEFTFPPGIYEALRVKIGTAEGKNWWCVMFPPLCFVDETYSVVDEKSQKKLKHLLTEEEYNTLTKQGKPVKVKYKFKIWDSIKKLFD